MKHIAAYALAFLISTASFAQQNNAPKPTLFQNYADIINCSEAELARAINFTQGQSVTVAFDNNFSFSGIVTSNTVVDNTIQSIIIKSPLLNNTILQISKRNYSNGNAVYIGRIINQNYFDGYELKKNAAGNYQLTKIETDKVIQPCH